LAVTVTVVVVSAVLVPLTVVKEAVVPSWFTTANVVFCAVLILAVESYTSNVYVPTGSMTVNENAPAVPCVGPPGSETVDPRSVQVVPPFVLAKKNSVLEVATVPVNVTAPSTVVAITQLPLIGAARN
jgi:hypothetical protein